MLAFVSMARGESAWPLSGQGCGAAPGVAVSGSADSSLQAGPLAGRCQ